MDKKFLTPYQFSIEVRSSNSHARTVPGEFSHIAAKGLKSGRKVQKTTLLQAREFLINKVGYPPIWFDVSLDLCELADKQMNVMGVKHLTRSLLEEFQLLFRVTKNGPFSWFEIFVWVDFDRDANVLLARAIAQVVKRGGGRATYFLEGYMVPTQGYCFFQFRDCVQRTPYFLFVFQEQYSLAAEPQRRLEEFKRSLEPSYDDKAYDQFMNRNHFGTLNIPRECMLRMPEGFYCGNGITCDPDRDVDCAVYVWDYRRQRRNDPFSALERILEKRFDQVAVEFDYYRDYYCMDEFWR